MALTHSSSFEPAPLLVIRSDFDNAQFGELAQNAVA